MLPLYPRYGLLPNGSRPVSRLVLGSIAFSTDDQALADELLDRFVEAGGTAVDTARVYARGSSELARLERARVWPMVAVARPPRSDGGHWQGRAPRHADLRAAR